MSGRDLDELVHLLRELSGQCCRFVTDENAAIDIARVLCDIFGDEFQAPSPATRTLPADLELVSGCPPIPVGTTEFSQGLSVLVEHSVDFREITFRPRSALSESTPAHVLPWRAWWEEEPVYMLSGEPVTRRDVVIGCSNAIEGFRIANPAGNKWKPVGLLIAGEGVPWPPGSAQLADVRQIAHEVLNSPAIRQLAR